MNEEGRDPINKARQITSRTLSHSAIHSDAQFTSRMGILDI
jgi:hypothetical protein